jgi:hypothetical protein
MFDWFWKGVAGLSGIVALWFGFDAARTRNRMEREKAEREEAMKSMIDKAYRDLDATKKRFEELSPINPEKRDDFDSSNGR